MTGQASRSRFRALLGSLRAVLLTAIAVVIILAAVLVGIGRALIPYADEMRPWLALHIGERIGQEVRLERIEAQWPRLTPQVHLFGLEVGPTDAALLEIDETRLELHLPDLLRGDRNPFRLVVLGLDLVLVQDQQGNWGLELEGGAALGERNGRDVVPAGDLLVRDASLTVRPANQPAFGARLVEGEIRRRGPRTEVQGLLEPDQESGPGLRFALGVDHPDGRWREARAWLLGDELVPSQWLGADGLPESARASVEGWARWSVDEGARVDLDLSLMDAGLGSDRVGAELVLSSASEINQIELVRLYTGRDETVSLARGVALGLKDSVIALAVDELDLGALHALVLPWLARWPALPTHADGRVVDLELALQPNGSLHALRGEIQGLSLELPDPLPQLTGLDLALALSGDRAVLMPGGQPQVVWPILFEPTVALEAIGGRILLSPQAMELDQVSIQTAFASGSVDGWILLWEGRPFLDFSIDAQRVAEVDPRPYLPPRFVPEAAMDWLEQSLGWVEQASGYVVLHMRAGKLARDIQPGDFQAEVAFEGVDIDYWPDWPRAGGLAGQAQFLGRSLSAQLEQSSLGAVAVDRADLDIPDLTEPTLALSLVASRAEAAEVAALLAEMPVDGFTGVIETTRWSGPAAIALDLGLPFRDMETWSMDGIVDLDRTRLALPGVGLGVDGLSGRAEFDRRRLSADELEVQVGDHSWPMALEAAFDAPAWLRLVGTINPLPWFPGLAEQALHASGQSRFELLVTGRDGGGLGISLSSDLRGLALDLPAPMTKPAAQAWPLALQVLVDENGQAGSLEIESMADANWRLADGNWALAIGLDHAVPDLPASNGLIVRGRLAELALTDWFELLGENEAHPGAAASVDIQLQLDRVEALGLELDDLSLSLDRDELAWQLLLDSERMAGRITVPVPLDSGRVLVADLERLRLAPVDPEPVAAELGLQPLSAQTSTRSPLGLPPLHLFIESLRWGELDLGRARLEAHAAVDGMEVELIDISGPDLRLHGRGRWVEREQRLQSEFHGRLSTADLSGLLQSAGYESGLLASRAQVDLDVRWPGAPMDFSLGRLSGSLDLRINDGAIPEARPGAGRLLGLASFTAIPRRLMLDFRDVFGAGFKFDQIEGRFDLAAGFARTDGLQITAPAANITITGDTDMAAREYDQIIVVEPGLGATLPLIGVLAGGPAGAAAGLVLRTLLERPLRGIAEARYSVTGSWDDPLIELVQARVTDEAGEEAIIGPPAPVD